MRPASSSAKALQSPMDRAAAEVPDMQQPADAMEPSDEEFPMPVITEVVSLASINEITKFVARKHPEFLPKSIDESSNDEVCSDPEDTNGGTLAHYPNLSETPLVMTKSGVLRRCTQYADKKTASASGTEASLSSYLPNASGSSASARECQVERYGVQQANVKIEATTDNSDVSTAVVGGFVPRVMKNSNDRKYERRLPSNSAASVTQQIFLLPVPISQMPLHSNPMATLSRVTELSTATSELVPDNDGVSYRVRPSRVVIFSPAVGTVAPNVQSGEPSVQPSAPTQAPPITQEIKPSVPLQVPLSTQEVKPSVPLQVPLISQPNSSPNVPTPAPLIIQEISPSAPPCVPMITVPITTIPQSTQQPVVPARVPLITEGIRLVSAPVTTVSQYHGTKCQVTPAPHGSMKTTCPSQPLRFQAPSGLAAVATASCQSSNQLPKGRVEEPQKDRGSLQNSLVSAVNNRDSKQKSQSSCVTSHANKAVRRASQPPKAYPTQVWQRSKATASREGLSKLSQAAQGNAQRSSVLNSSWERIIVSSDIESMLSLDEVRKGIETFLMVNGVPESVSKGGIIQLHWNGRDLGSFRFKHGSNGSCPTARHVVTEEAIVISSDEEQDQEAPKVISHTVPCTSNDKQAEKTGDTTATARTMPVTCNDEEREEAIHTAPATATASARSVCMDSLLEPQMILRELDKPLHLKPSKRPLSDSEDSSSDSEKASENSNDDPTYNPLDELDDISSEDELPSLSSDELDEGKNHELPGAGKLTYPSSNGSSSAKKQKSSGSSRDGEFELRSDDSSPAELGGKNDSPQSSHMKKYLRKVRQRPVTRLPFAKEEPTLCHVVLPPCCVELFPIDTSLLVNGSVNLSVVKEEELFITDQGAHGPFEHSWARLANAFAQMPDLVGDW